MLTLRLGAERVQATADDLPLDLAGASWACAGQSDPMRRHMSGFADYTTALNCVQILLAAHKAGTQ